MYTGKEKNIVIVSIEMIMKQLRITVDETQILLSLYHPSLYHIAELDIMVNMKMYVQEPSCGLNIQSRKNTHLEE